MARGDAEQATSSETLTRTCHLCGKVLDTRVWYARNEETRKRRVDLKHRVYACPVCYFSLKDDGRKDYYRERL